MLYSWFWLKFYAFGSRTMTIKYITKNIKMNLSNTQLFGSETPCYCHIFVLMINQSTKITKLILVYFYRICGLQNTKTDIFSFG